MESLQAIDALGALAQASRLEIFKYLVRAGEEISAGDIARELDLPPSTLSTHLAILARAGLVSNRRESRTIFYAADMSGISDLLAYLVEDCCDGHPEVCAPISTMLARASCCPPGRDSTTTKKKKRARATANA